MLRSNTESQRTNTTTKSGKGKYFSYTHDAMPFARTREHEKCLLFAFTSARVGGV